MIMGDTSTKLAVCLDLGGLERWFEQRDWVRRPSFVGNEMLNIGTLLQYARDYQKNTRCIADVRFMLEWMTSHHVNPATGLWGGLNESDPRQLSRLVQAGYHFWLLYFHDRRPVPYPKRVLTSAPKTYAADLAREFITQQIPSTAAFAKTSIPSIRWRDS